MESFHDKYEDRETVGDKCRIKRKRLDEASRTRWELFPESRTSYDPTKQDCQQDESTQSFKLPQSHCSFPEVLFPCAFLELNERESPEFLTAIKPGSTLLPPLCISPLEKDQEDPDVKFSDWLDLTEAPDSSEVYAPITSHRMLTLGVTDDHHFTGTNGLTAAEANFFIRLHHKELGRYHGSVLENLTKQGEAHINCPTYLEDPEVFQSTFDQISRTEGQNLLTLEHPIVVYDERHLKIAQQSQPIQGKSVRPPATSSEYCSATKLHSLSNVKEKQSTVEDKQLILGEEQTSHCKPATLPRKLIVSAVSKSTPLYQSDLSATPKAPPLGCSRFSLTYGNRSFESSKMADMGLHEKVGPVTSPLRALRLSEVSESLTVSPSHRGESVELSETKLPPKRKEAPATTRVLRSHKRQATSGAYTATHAKAPSLQGGKPKVAFAPRTASPTKAPSLQSGKPQADSGTHTASDAKAASLQSRAQIPTKEKKPPVTTRVLRPRKNQETSNTHAVSHAEAPSSQNDGEATATQERTLYIYRVFLPPKPRPLSTANAVPHQNNSTAKTPTVVNRPPPIRDFIPPPRLIGKIVDILTTPQYERSASGSLVARPFKAPLRHYHKCEKCDKRVFVENFSAHQASECQDFELCRDDYIVQQCLATAARDGLDSFFRKVQMRPPTFKFPNSVRDSDGIWRLATLVPEPTRVSGQQLPPTFQSSRPMENSGQPKGEEKPNGDL